MRRTSPSRNIIGTRSCPRWIAPSGLSRLGETNQPIHVRLGPGGPPVCDEPTVRIVNLSGEYMSTRNIAAMELPAKLFGKTDFKPGDTIAFDSTFFTQARADRVEWKGRFTLRK